MRSGLRPQDFVAEESRMVDTAHWGGCAMWLLGVREIPWYEFPSASIRGKRKLRKRPFGSGFRQPYVTGSLSVAPIRVFTAMARTAALHLNWLEEQFEVSGLWLRYSRHFSSDKTISLRNGSCEYYKDAEMSEWASRLGEAFGYLEMQRRGYAFLNHFQNILGAASGKRTPGWLSVGKRPDYFCEPMHGSHLLPALAEFKGSIPRPGGRSGIKGDLAKALSQTVHGQTLVNLPSHRTFAVATYIREKDDQNPEPSLVAISDPESEDQERGDPPSISREDLRELTIRGNYGAWLQMMGLVPEGMALVDRHDDLETDYYHLASVFHAGHRYVFRLDPLMFPCRDRILSCLDAPLFGLREDVFAAVMSCLHDSKRSLWGSISELALDSPSEHMQVSPMEELIHVFLDGTISIARRAL